MQCLDLKLCLDYCYLFTGKTSPEPGKVLGKIGMMKDIRVCKQFLDRHSSCPFQLHTCIRVIHKVLKASDIMQILRAIVHTYRILVINDQIRSRFRPEKCCSNDSMYSNPSYGKIAITVAHAKCPFIIIACFSLTWLRKAHYSTVITDTIQTAIIQALSFFTIILISSNCHVITSE